MFSGETYGGGHKSVKRLSRAELQKIKKNMKKVPLIQKKSAIYHQSEAQKAEELLESILEKQNNDAKSYDTQEGTSEEKKSRYHGIWKKVTTFLGL